MTRAPRIEDPRYELADAVAIRALQLRRLREMLRFAVATNAFYRERLDAAGVDVERSTRSRRSRARVPTVEKADFVADQEAHPPFGRRLERAVRRSASGSRSTRRAARAARASSCTRRPSASSPRWSRCTASCSAGPASRRAT